MIWCAAKWAAAISRCWDDCSVCGLNNGDMAYLIPQYCVHGHILISTNFYPISIGSIHATSTKTWQVMNESLFLSLCNSSPNMASPINRRYIITPYRWLQNIFRFSQILLRLHKWYTLLYMLGCS